METPNKVVRAVFEEGVFKPIGPVNLSDGTFVLLNVHPLVPETQAPTPEQKLSAIAAIMNEKAAQTPRRIEHRP